MMENNTIEINIQSGNITHTYVPQTEELDVQLSESELDRIYKENIVRLIRLRYTQDDENAIQRKYLSDKEANEEEFLEYHNYVEQCKLDCK